MKANAKTNSLAILFLLSIFLIFFVAFALAPSIIWTSDSDWSGGTFTNITNIAGENGTAQTKV